MKGSDRAMELRAYLVVLRKHIVVITLLALAGAGLGLVAYLHTPPTYASVVEFYVSTPQPEGSNAQSAGQFAQARVNSYVRLLTSEELARRVVKVTGVDLPASDVARRIGAEADVETVLLTTTVTDTDAQRSLAIARGVSTEFPKLVDELDNQGRKTALVVIKTVSGPTLKPWPVAPRLRLNLLVGLAIGALLGVLTALVREVLDTSIRSGEDAQRMTNVPTLAVIPLDPATRRSPLIVREQAMSRRAEAYRKLRTNLQFMDVTRNDQVLLVTSSVPQEGKSVTALNLALSLVEAQRKVLVIDADMRRPRAAQYLDLPNEVGLSNVLASQVDVDEAIQQWGDEGLLFLASGVIPPNPSELLGSYQMQALISSLRTQYDHIIIDTPPLLPVTDAVVASTHADAVLLVVRSGKTPRAHVVTAMRSLDTAGAPLIGTVLNLVRSDSGESSYSQSYYEKDTSRRSRDRASRTTPTAEPAQQPKRGAALDQA